MEGAMETPATPPMRTCLNHPSIRADLYCMRCDRPICQVCAFEVGLRTFCPDCMLAGDTPEQKKASFNYGIGSVLLAVLSVALLIGMFGAYAAMESKQAEIMANGLGLLVIASLLGGLTLGLVGRDQARRTGSPLATLGMVSNGVILAVYLGLMILGLSKR